METMWTYCLLGALGLLAGVKTFNGSMMTFNEIRSCSGIKVGAEAIVLSGTLIFSSLFIGFGGIMGAILEEASRFP